MSPRSAQLHPCRDSRQRALDLRRNQHRTRTPRLNARDDAPYNDGDGACRRLGPGRRLTRPNARPGATHPVRSQGERSRLQYKTIPMSGSNPATTPRAPSPNSTRPAILTPPPRSTAARRHRRSTLNPTTPRGTASPRMPSWRISRSTVCLDRPGSRCVPAKPSSCGGRRAPRATARRWPHRS